ncbi:18021_t:CDS:2 [Acaulospora morrowiae]|uniref:18021_t:CDS:1 n=1 Tax=Acaulospora morrowiae TaxID=94023 RepID=A0A9N8UZT7_9GLOM|nr:18021_t:CDS:2 [Acaulospora morrowiae]
MSEEDLKVSYEKQLSRVKNLDPVLNISPNQVWINQQGWPAYYTVMDTFATNGLQNRRRDENSLCVFHLQQTPNSILYAAIITLFFQTPSLSPCWNGMDAIKSEGAR